MISMAQIDPNGVCNAKCWFCPVAYAPNPDIGKKTMPIEMFRSLITQLHEGKGDFVSPRFNGIYTAHYNEVLMYPHLEEMFEILREFNLGTLILSNGTTLTPKRIDLLAKYPDVIRGVCLNIPASDPDTWARLTGMNAKMFPHLIANIKYFHDTMPLYVARKAFSIQINGVTENSLINRGGWVTQLSKAPALDLDPETGDLRKAFNGFKQMFPDTQIYEMPSLIDRAGHLENHEVITNRDGIDRYLSQGKTRVVGCGNGREVGGRPNGWVHVNANGDLFLCCNDYNFDTIFGNLTEESLKTIWTGELRQQTIEQAYQSMCRTCASAIWE